MASRDSGRARPASCPMAELAGIPPGKDGRKTCASTKARMLRSPRLLILVRVWPCESFTGPRIPKAVGRRLRASTRTRNSPGRPTGPATEKKNRRVHGRKFRQQKQAGDRITDRRQEEHGQTLEQLNPLVKWRPGTARHTGHSGKFLLIRNARNTRRYSLRSLMTTPASSQSLFQCNSAAYWSEVQDIACRKVNGQWEGYRFFEWA